MYRHASIVVLLLCAFNSALAQQPVGTTARQGVEVQLKREWEQANTLMSSGHVRESIPHFEQALAIAKQHAGPAHDITLTISQRLAYALNLNGEGEKARPLLQDVLTQYEQKYGKDDPHVASVLRNIAYTHTQQRDYAKAESYLRRSIDIIESKLGKGHIQVTDSLNDLAVAYANSGRLNEAEDLLEEVLRIRLEKLEPTHPHIALARSNLSDCQLQTHQYDKAQANLEKTLAIYEAGVHLPQLRIDTVLTRLARCHLGMGDRKGAERHLERAVTLAEQAYGKQAPEVGVTCSWIADVYSKHGLHDAAVPYHEQALRIVERNYGRNHPHTLTVLSALGATFCNVNKPDRAKVILEEVLAHQERSVDTKPEDLASTLAWLRDTYIALGQSEEAHRVADRALRIRSQNSGATPDDLVSQLYEITATHLQLGTPIEGLTAAERVMEKLKRVCEPTSLPHARAQCELGRLYTEAGKFAEAEQMLQQSLEIHERIQGKSSKHVAEALDALAHLYSRTGRQVDAEHVMLRVLSIYRELYPFESKEIANQLVSLGFVHERLGEFEKAAAEYRDAILIGQRLNDRFLCAYGKTHLGHLCGKTGQLSEAERLLTEALDVYESNAVGHAGIASWCRMYLAYVRLDQTRPDLAEPLVRKSLEEFERRLGPDHADVATALSTLGDICTATGNLPEAEKYELRANKLLQQQYGDSNYNVTSSCLSLADIYRLGQAPDLAMRWMRAAIRIQRRYIEHSLPGLSARQQWLFLDRSASQAYYWGMAFGGRYGDRPEVAAESAEWLLNNKSMSVDVLARLNQLALDSSDPEARAIRAELAAVRRQIAASYLTPPRGMPASEFHSWMAALSQHEEMLAKKLGVLVKPADRDPWISLAQVREALPDDSIYIDIARVPLDVWDLKNGDKPKWRYYAWVVPPKNRGLVHVVDLGDAAQIDTAIAQVKMHIQTQNHETDEDMFLAHGRHLARLAWSPLEKSTANFQHLILSPDGALWLVPWEAMPIAGRKYLIEEKEISYVTTGRDLIRRRESIHASGVVAFTNPDYGPIQPYRSVADTSDESGPALGALHGGIFLPLPKTEASVPELAAKLNQPHKVLVGQKASESAFGNLHSPLVLILDTHGFFLEDPHHDNLPTVEALRPHWDHLQRYSTTLKQTGQAVDIMSPLLRCGLAFAGANLRELHPGNTDGVLTGMEVLAADLRGTELVVLNACETGVGSLRNGVGVVGLRQAFLQTGARTVVSTLWSVPVKQSDWLAMRLFENLAAGQKRSEALRGAQLALLNHLRATTGSAHPFYWAAFTTTGDWKPVPMAENTQDSMPPN